jgi:hypothetical protein
VGVNTDALEWEPYDVGGPPTAPKNTYLDQYILHEAKTAKKEKADRWRLGYSMSINYRRQIYHGMWVCGAYLGKSHVLGLEDHEYGNPFGVEDIRERVATYEFSLADFDVEEHEIRIMYLTDCYLDGRDPSTTGLNLYGLNYEFDFSPPSGMKR